MTTYDRSSPVYFVALVPDGDGGPTIRVDDFADRVLSFKYEDEEQKADRVTLTLDNFDLALYDDPAFKHGMLLDVSWGYPGRMAPTRRCVVQSIKGGKTVTVTAVAQSILMNKTVHSKTYRNARYSDAARWIAWEAGFGDDAIDIEETPVVHETITCARLTDAQFLRRLADKEGYEFYVDHEGFHFHRRRVDQSPTRTFVYYRDREGGDVLDFSLDDDITKPKARHRRRGRNLTERTEIDAEASNETDTNRATLAPVASLPTPRTPASSPTASAPSTFVTFDRDTSAPLLSGRASADERVASEETAPTTAQDTTTAEREAVGANRRSRQTAIKLKLDVIGDPYVLAKTVIAVEGLGTRLSGRYYVKRVVSTLGNDGTYKVQLEVISDGHGGHARRSRVARDLELDAREEPNTGAPNTAPPADADALEPVVTFDRDTSAPVTTFRPRTQRRGGT